MSRLIDRIKADQLAARKARDATVANILGVIISMCDTKAKQGKVARSLIDDEILMIVKSVLKQIGETLSLLIGNTERADEVVKLTREQTQLLFYLPKQLTVEEITEIAIRQHSFGLSLGQIMVHLKTEYAGRYDAKQASEIVRDVVSP